MTFTITDELIPVSEAVEEIPTYVDSLERMDKIEGTSEKTETVEQAFPESLQNAKVNLTDVSFSYEAGAKKAIDQLNLTILPGEKLGVLGKSGTGKSTLLKLIAGVLEPDHGEVKVNGIDMKDDYLAEAVSVLNQIGRASCRERVK